MRYHQKIIVRIWNNEVLTIVQSVCVCMCESDNFDTHLHNEVFIIIQIISISASTFVNGNE